MADVVIRGHGRTLKKINIHELGGRLSLDLVPGMAVMMASLSASASQRGGMALGMVLVSIGLALVNARSLGVYTDLVMDKFSLPCLLFVFEILHPIPPTAVISSRTSILHRANSDRANMVESDTRSLLNSCIVTLHLCRSCVSYSHDSLWPNGSQWHGGS